jgi:ribosomal-protein-alanine N-acetyltransferase
LGALVALDGACFDKPWSEASLHEELSHPDASNWGIYPLPEGLAAAILTRLVGDERWIFRIMTHPEYRRQGLAKKLLEALPKEPLWLEVSEHNLSAIQFYKQAGFKLVAKRPGYYPEDALIMKSFP